MPGTPDIVLPRHGLCIFVHGCFWHLHRNCKDARIPKTRTVWWRKKLEGNSTRDKRHTVALRRLGWRVITIWECETKKDAAPLKRLANLLTAHARKSCEE
jgi:DNA mismatch endonuclease (patch repair protein)